MFFIVASLVLFVCLLAGWGAWCAHLLQQKTDNPWLFPFLGMFAAGIAFTFASLLFPLNNISLLLFILFGLTGLPSWIRVLRQSQAALRERNLIFAATLLSYVLIISARCAWENWPGTAYDTDLYHANIVCWLNEYGAVTGLANLHTRLGMNSLWLNLAAVLDNGPWDNRSAWIMPPLLFFCSLAYLLYNVVFSSQRALRVFCLCMMPFTLTRASISLYSDQLAQFAIAILIAECLILRKNSVEATPAQISLLLCLAALAFVIKPIAGISLLFVSAFALRCLQKTGRLSLCNTAKVFAPAVLAGIVWITYNCLLSGWPLFPLPFFPLTTDWTVPAEMINDIYTSIIAWARAPGPGYRESLGNWNWFVPWLKRQSASGTFWRASASALASLPLWAYSLCGRSKGAPAFFCAWAMLNLVYWFLAAPDFRFGRVLFQINFALAAAFALQKTSLPQAALLRVENIFAQFFGRLRKPLSMSIVALCLIASIYIVKEIRPSGKSIFNIGTIPSRTVASRVLDSSVSPPILLFFPTQGNQCGNSPLPCTPSDNPNLRLRRPGDLGSGFTLK